MIFRSRLVALMLGVLGLFGQLLGAFAGLRLGAVALRGLLPVLDLLLHGHLVGLVARRAEDELALVGHGLHHGAADALGLEERPEVGGLDVLADRFGLRALAERLRDRQKQRQDGDQERDLLVRAGRVFGVLGMLHAFMCAHKSLLARFPTIDRTVGGAQEVSAPRGLQEACKGLAMTASCQ